MASQMREPDWGFLLLAIAAGIIFGVLAATIAH
jgi:hypothetical protein